MKSLFKLVFAIALIAIIGVGTFIYGFKIGGEKETIEVNSQMIMNRITDKYFVVTKTVILDQQTQIVIDKGSEWSNLLWGQKIDAEAKVRVDIGVDMSGIKDEDIIVDDTSKLITISIPHAEILSTNIVGNFDVKSKDGLLKTIFDDTTNEDYNDAIRIMKDNASKEVMNNIELLKSAEDNSTHLIELIIDNLGYNIEFSLINN